MDMKSLSQSYGSREDLGTWKRNLTTPFGLTKNQYCHPRCTFRQVRIFGNQSDGTGNEGPAWFRLFSICHVEFGLGQLIIVVGVDYHIRHQGRAEVPSFEGLGQAWGRSVFLGGRYVKEAVKEARSLISGDHVLFCESDTRMFCLSFCISEGTYVHESARR